MSMGSDIPKVFEAEYRLCNIVWDNQPLGTAELVRLCADRLGWKKSTVFTVLRRLCERGVLQNRRSSVTALFTREQIRYGETEEFLDRLYGGSAANLVAAVAAAGELTAAETERIRRVLDNYGGDEV